MAAVPPGRELCPHCHRPFKRLRKHLPHCKAAPRPAPGTAPGPGPSTGLGPAATSAPGANRGLGQSPGPASVPSAPGKSSQKPSGPSIGKGLPGSAPREAAAAARKGKKAAGEKGGEGSGPGPRRQPDGRGAEREVEPAVQDVARSLDLLPEEVKGLPEKLSNGVKIVIEKHRARVLREKGGSGGASAGSSSSNGPPGKGGRAKTEPYGRGAAEDVPASPEGGKGSSVKATVNPPILQDPPASRSGPTDLQQEARDQPMTEEQQMYLEAGVEYKAPLPALHTKSLHLSAREGFRGHGEGTSKNYLTSSQKLGGSEKQMVAVSEPILDARRDTELAQHQFLLHTSQSHPICPPQAPGRSTAAGSLGLEWFLDLYPNYHRLSVLPGKPSQEDGITRKPPKGSFSEGHQGPLSERCLLDVRLGELPMWLATRDLSPQGLLGGVQRAWSSYCDKYINVKRGGAPGVSMLLAGYCLLSYGWSYQHIKGHRWRKYH